jgi:hypothetical protein
MNPVKLVWILGIQCKRCDGVWTPKNFNITLPVTDQQRDKLFLNTEKPHVCAKCRSPYYDRDRKSK